MKFVKIPRAIFEFGLKPMDIMVYCGIRSYCNNENYTIVKADTVGKLVGCSRNRIYESVKRLEEAGLISKTPMVQTVGKYKNYKGANRYDVNEIKGKWILLNTKVFSYKLSSTGFVAYLYIKSCSNHKGNAYPSYEQIKGKTNASLTASINAVKTLADFGLVLVDKAMRIIGCWGHNNYKMQNVLLRVAGCIKKRTLQSVIGRALCNVLLILVEYMCNIFNTMFRLRISYLGIKIKTNFLNRHRFYRRV